MKDLLDKIAGYKTYAIVAIIIVIASIQGLNAAEVINWPIPEYAWPILGAFGLGFLRAGVKKGEL